MIQATFRNIVLSVATLLFTGVSHGAPYAEMPQLQSDGPQKKPVISTSRFLESYLQFLRVLQDRQSNYELVNGIGFYASLELGRRVVNLTPQRTAADDSQRWPGELVLNDDRDGFRVTRKWKLDVAAGPGHIIDDLPAIVGGPFSALMPVVGRSVTMVQTFEKREDIPKTILKLKVPFKAAETDSWKIGDRITYDAAAGIMIGIGTNLLPTVGLEGRYLAKGIWTTDIEKFGDKSVYLKLTARSVKSLTHIGSAFGAMLARRDFGELDYFLSFAFDLSDPIGTEAYERALRGDLAFAGELADSGSDVVKRLIVGNSRAYGNSTKFSVGVVLLANLSWEKTNERAKISTRNIETATTRTLHYALYSTEKQRSGWLLVGARSGLSFMARNVSDSDSDSENYSAELQWGFERGKTKKKHLVKALNQVKKRLGLETELALEVPDADLNYLAAVMRLIIPKKATDALIDSAGNSDKDSILFTSAMARVKSYFDAGEDSASLCALAPPSGPVEVVPDNSETLEECKMRLKRETAKAASKMTRALREMKKTRDQSPRKFVAAYAKFGKWMMINRFSFHAALGEIADRATGFVFTVEGESISRFVRPLRIAPAGNY